MIYIKSNIRSVGVGGKVFSNKGKGEFWTIELDPVTEAELIRSSNFIAASPIGLKLTLDEEEQAKLDEKESNKVLAEVAQAVASVAKEKIKTKKG